MSLAARILLAASVALLASSEVSAETMPTTNTMDDASDMLADFARYEMDASTLTLVNASTGAPLSERSAAALSDADPETPDDFDLGLFVHASDMDPTVAPGSTVNVTVCDFSRPENCAKAVPYPGAPEEYACGESDETKPDVGFECVALEAIVDEDGDLSLGRDGRATHIVDVPRDVGGEKRRHHDRCRGIRRRSDDHSASVRAEADAGEAGVSEAQARASVQVRAHRGRARVQTHQGIETQGRVPWKEDGVRTSRTTSSAGHGEKKKTAIYVVVVHAVWIIVMPSATPSARGAVDTTDQDSQTTSL